MLDVKNIDFNKIESLAAFGCSLTYGAELKNPQKSSWVPILGKLLKIPNVYNFGLRGDSTPHISLRTITYIERIKVTNSYDPSKVFIIVMASFMIRKLYSCGMDQTPPSYISLRNTSISAYDKYMNIKKYRPPYQQRIIFNFYNLTIFNNFNNIKRQVKLLDAYLKQSGHPYIIVPCDRRYDFIGNDVEGYVYEFTTSRGYQIGENGHPLEEANYAYAKYLHEKLTNESR